MQNSKLYSILNHFNKYEQNRLRKYLLSPYFNKNKVLTKLFEIIINNINSKDVPQKELTKEGIWSLLFEENDYEDVRYRKLSSDLLKLVESFLAQQVYEENPLHEATYLIEAVGKKKLDKLYNGTMKTARRLSKQQLYKPAEFYYYQYQIEKQYYDLTESEFRRAARKNVEDIANNLDFFYLAEKLRYYCSILSQQYFISHEYELLFLDEIIAHIEKYKFEDIPPIAVYYQVYLTLVDTENEAHYFKLKELLEKYGLQFPLNQSQVLYEHALNYCVRQNNLGKSHFLKELVDLYKDSLKKEIIYTDGELAPWHFKNIVTSGLRLGTYTWVEDFIHTYNEKLPEVFRHNAVTYNLAQVYFYQKKYSDVVSLLQEVEYEDVSYNLGSKSMLLATYYETDEIEPLYSLFDSFRVFLNRHKSIPPQRRRNYLNLIKFTKQLTRIIPGDKKAIDKLKHEVEKEKSIASSNWLKEKITELE